MGHRTTNCVDGESFRITWHKITNCEDGEGFKISRREKSCFGHMGHERMATHVKYHMKVHSHKFED